MTRVTNDITQVQNLVSTFVRGLIRTSCLTLGSIFFLSRMNRQFGLIVLCAFPFMVAVMALCLFKAAPLFPRLQAELDQVNAILQEDVSGIRIIKACVREIGEKLRFGKANDAQIRTQLKTLVIFAFMNPAINALMYAAITLVLWSGANQVGTGKTTLVSLIPRFYDVTAGEILVDGMDVRAYKQTALREKVSMALQKAELFSVSIGENISWGKPGAEPDEIQDAARIAQAEEFIGTTADGYDSAVAQKGMSLSGGQKQRVSVARAVLKPAPVLIFDDSTSALDLKTEAALNEALNTARPGCTKIIVAQRIASARRADRILVLSRGRMEACGSHETLMEISPTYRDIYHSQMGSEVDSNG